MKLNIIEQNSKKIAEVISEEIVIHSTQDALDLIGDASYYQSHSIIIREENLAPGFFNLKTRIAGEILQKFSQYGVQIAIIGEFTKFNSDSLAAFIRESNKGTICSFVADKEEAINMFLK